MEIQQIKLPGVLVQHPVVIQAHLLMVIVLRHLPLTLARPIVAIVLCKIPIDAAIKHTILVITVPVELPGQMPGHNINAGLMLIPIVRDIIIAEAFVLPAQLPPQDLLPPPLQNLVSSHHHLPSPQDLPANPPKPQLPNLPLSLNP